MNRKKSVQKGLIAGARSEMEKTMKELGIYIHIPFCERKCLYCDFLSGCGSDLDKEQYVEALIKDIVNTSHIAKDYIVKTIYMGGGTPSVLSPLFTERIMKTVYDNYNIDENVEATIEINPKTADYFKLKRYISCGFNRLSIGLQSSNNEELKLLGRIHTFEEFLQTYDEAMRAGFDDISVDVMSAIPGQSISSYENTLKKVIMLRPKHISSYSLIVEENTPFYEMYGENGENQNLLVGEDDERKMYYLTKELLGKAGYERYEISNYSKPGYESRHNTNYWLRKEYLGFGASAASYINNERYTSICDVDEYVKYVNSQKNGMDYEIPKSESFILSKDNRVEESIFLGLRMINGISLKEFEEEFGFDIQAIYGNVIKKYVDMGYMELSEGVLRLTEDGIDVSNTIFADFIK